MGDVIKLLALLVIAAILLLIGYIKLIETGEYSNVQKIQTNPKSY
jgi:hypothetical protein